MFGDFVSNLEKVYFIGGSPCSGKSSIAELLTKDNRFYYFKVDDFLDKYLNLGALNKKTNCFKIKQMTSDEIWMRDCLVQSEEEFQIYDEIFEFILNDITNINSDKPIIAEGAAFTPNLMKNTK